MSAEGSGSRAAELAAHQVEAIVAAAEQSAEELRLQAARDAERITEKALHEARGELDSARAEAEQLRAQARREVRGRLAAAEDAAAQVLEEAKTLSSGLRQLGATLQSQGERILRDVQAAHKRMQAELRVASFSDEERRSRFDREAGGTTAGREGRSRAKPD